MANIHNALILTGAVGAGAEVLSAITRAAIGLLFWLI